MKKQNNLFVDDMILYRGYHKNNTHKNLLDQMKEFSNLLNTKSTTYTSNEQK